MPDKSKFRIVVPDGDLLTYLLPPEDHGDGDQRLWIDAEDTSRYITRLGTLQWVKSLSVAFQRMGVRVGDVVLMFSPNHIYVPPAYIGTVAHGAVFTAASPASTTRGTLKESSSYHSTDGSSRSHYAASTNKG